MKKLIEIEEQLRSTFVERDDEIRGLSLSILSDNNMLLIGPPGTAKSMVVHSWSSHIIEQKFFSALLSKFSTPEELAGPFSIKSLGEDRYIRQTNGMLPEAHIAFLDETFNGNSGVLNFLLTLMNERKFANDGKFIKVPLLTLVGASNQIPEPEDALEAMYDRFLLKFIVSPIIEDENFVKMIMMAKDYKPEVTITLPEIEHCREQVQKVKVPKSVIRTLADLRALLHHDGILTTDRTFKRSSDIIKAEAFLNGRAEVVEDDLDVLKNVLWTNPDDLKKCYTDILTIINPDKNKVLDIWDTCSLGFDKFKNEEDPRKITDLGSELLVNLKASKEKVHEYYEKAKASNNHAKEVLDIEKKIHNLINAVYKGLGLDF